MAVISRERAAGIAAAAIAGRADDRDPMRVGKVLSVEEINFARPNIYGFPDHELDKYWIAYLEPLRIVGLCSSTVMLISRLDGEICYWGSANDEG